MRLPLFPLSTVLFPGGVLPLPIFEARYMDMARDCLRNDTQFGVCMITDPKANEASRDAAVAEVGCSASIAGWDMRQLGLLHVRAIGSRRFRVIESATEANGLKVAEIEWLEDDADQPIAAEHVPCVELLGRIIDDLRAQAYLPLIGDLAPVETSVTTPPPRGKGCVLFVDDEAALVDLGQKMLEYLGYEVVAETSSRDALGVFRVQPERFDLVITDYTMPHLTGMQLVKSIKELRADLPIIVCTGFSEAITCETIKDWGISDYLMKPLVLQDMAKAVHRLLQIQTTGAKSKTSTA